MSAAQKNISSKKNKLTLFTFTLTGAFLILTGTPLAGSGVTNSAGYSYNPYLPLGMPLIILGLAMIAFAAFQRISQLQAQVIVGFCGQTLLGMVILIIPTLYWPSPFSPFNLHTYSIVLGLIGIALSIESLIVISKTKRAQQ